MNIAFGSWALFTLYVLLISAN